MPSPMFSRTPCAGLSKAVSLADFKHGSTQLSHFVNDIAPPLAAFRSCFVCRVDVMRRTFDALSKISREHTPALSSIRVKRLQRYLKTHFSEFDLESVFGLVVATAYDGVQARLSSVTSQRFLKGPLCQQKE
jgi:hypothetical protein